jgi:hypothetical protein
MSPRVAYPDTQRDTPCIAPHILFLLGHAFLQDSRHLHIRISSLGIFLFSHCFFFNLAFARALDIYATFTFLFMRYLYIYLRPQVGLAAEGVLGIRAEKKGGMKESHHTIRSLRRHN